MTPEERLKLLIGDLHFQIALVAAKAEALQKQVDEFKAKETSD